MPVPIEPLAVCRALVADGHAHVAAGRYAEAVGAFTRALTGLRAHLGPQHEEVTELEADVVAVREMMGVAAFAAEAGIRWPDQRLPGAPDDPAG